MWFLVKQYRLRIVALVVLMLVLGMVGIQLVAAGDWLEYLGPGGLGHAAVSGAGREAPLVWSETENICWKVEVPGEGWSSPVVIGNEIWLTTAENDGKTRSLLCYDMETGDKIKEFLIFDVETLEKRHGINSFASPTSVIEGDYIYAHFGAIGTACVERQSGKIIWQRTDIQWDPLQGYGACPCLYKDLLILSCDGGDVQFMIALDKTTGETVWKTDRSADFEGVAPVFRKGFCSPTVRHYNGRDYLLSSSSKAAYAYNPLTGEELWRFDFPCFAETSTMRPILWKDSLVVNSGFGDPATLYSIPMNLTGIVGGEVVQWENGRNIARCPVPVLIGDYLYGPGDQGLIWCVSMATGETLWRKRIDGEHWASPICQTGRVYFFDDSGNTAVIAANPEKCEVLATNTLDAGCMGTPAIIGETIILRTKTHLYRISETVQR